MNFYKRISFFGFVNNLFGTIPSTNMKKIKIYSLIDELINVIRCISSIAISQLTIKEKKEYHNYDKN